MIFNSYHAKSFTRLLQLCLNNQVFEVERILSLDVFFVFFLNIPSAGDYIRQANTSCDKT